MNKGCSPSALSDTMDGMDLGMDLLDSHALGMGLGLAAPKKASRRDILLGRTSQAALEDEQARHGLGEGIAPGDHPRDGPAPGPAAALAAPHAAPVPHDLVRRREITRGDRCSVVGSRRGLRGCARCVARSRLGGRDSSDAMR